MFVAACGIAIITQTNLGTTPISSLPYAVTGLTGYSFGTTTFFINLKVLQQAHVRLISAE